MTAHPRVQANRQWAARVFAGSPGAGRPLARGNTAGIVQLPLPELGDPALMQAQASLANADTSCFFAPSSNPLHYPVACFNRTREIQCCGHGLYAIANIVRAEVAAATTCIALRTGTSDVIAEFHDGDVTIALPLLGCEASPVPGWTAAAGTAPVAVAHAGGEDGYALWVYSSVDQVITLQLQAEVLAANTRRAIIATSWDATVPAGFVLRYFAPQHGVPEDPVTGSAMRIAAQYWRQHSGNSGFQVWQCSAAGGVAHAALDRQYCWLKGAHEATMMPAAA